MASVSSMHFHCLLSHTSPLPLFCSPLQLQGIRRNKNYSILCCKNNGPDQINPCESLKEECGKRRRELLFQAVAAAFTFPAFTSVAFAAEPDLPEGFLYYTDEVNKYKLALPKDWQVGSGEGDGVRSLTAFYPREISNSNVSLLISGLGADFTRLESFGKVDAFAENLVSGLDRSWQNPPGVEAKLIDSRSSNGFYYIEYTLKKPGESRRHLYSVLGMADNGTYNRLYTLTGQFVDEEEEKFAPIIQRAVKSFRLVR